MTIPAMFMNGTLEQDSPECKTSQTLVSGFLELYENLTVHQNLFTAAALSYSERGILPVRVLNPTDEPIVIYKRKLLGFMNFVETKNDYREVKVRRIASRSTSPHSPSNLKSPRTQEWIKERLFKELKLEDIDIPAPDMDRLKDIVWERRDCFSINEFDGGSCNIFEAEINLKPDGRPQYVPPIPIPYKRREALRE